MARFFVFFAFFVAEFFPGRGRTHRYKAARPRDCTHGGSVASFARLGKSAAAVDRGGVRGARFLLPEQAFRRRA